MKIPSGPGTVLGATGAGVQSWYWGEIHRGCCSWVACTHSPLAERSLVDEEHSDSGRRQHFTKMYTYGVHLGEVLVARS